MRSMTGFGAASASVDGWRFTVEMRTVNHRYLDVRIRIPGESLALEAAIDHLVRSRIHRGHCTVHVVAHREGEAGLPVDPDRLSAAATALAQVIRDNHLDPHLVAALAPSLETASTAGPDWGDAAVRDAVLSASAQAIDRVCAMRRTEGEAMTHDILEQTHLLTGLCDRIRDLAARHRTAAVQRFAERIAALCAEAHVVCDDARVETEATLAADKADINEELIRVGSHVAQLRELCASQGAVGRKTEFLVQEMHREINTIASKATSSDITHLAVDAKCILEKIREMAANVE